MRFQPIIVPRPSDKATIHITQLGAKSVTPAIPVLEEAPKVKNGALEPAVAFFHAALSFSDKATDSLSINFLENLLMVKAALRIANF